MRVVGTLALLSFFVSSGCSSADGYRQYKELENIAKKGDAVYRHYKTSDHATAKSALLNYITDLDELLKTNHPEDFALQLDVVVSYVRLAKLEESKDVAEHEKFMTKAVERCGLMKTKQENCSAAKLREIVDIMDRVKPK